MAAGRALAGTCAIGFERALVYRGNYLVSVVAGLIPLIAQVLFWSAVYGPSGGRLAGYDLRQIMTYFALVYVMQWGVATTSVELRMRDDIKSGDLNFHLLRPYHYLAVRLVMAASGRVLSFCMSLAAFIAVVVVYRNALAPPISAAQGLALVPAMLLAYLLAYLMSCLVGVIAFWTLEVATLSVLLRGVMLVLSGAAFPLDYIGGWAGALVRHSPFSYLVYFPTQLYLRPLSAWQTAFELSLAAAWAAALGALLSFLWAAGVRRYSAFGG